MSNDNAQSELKPSNDQSDSGSVSNALLSANVAQRVTDALLEYTEKRTNKLQALEVLVSELVAAVAELDARTAHVQR